MFLIVIRSGTNCNALAKSKTEYALLFWLLAPERFGASALVLGGKYPLPVYCILWIYAWVGEVRRNPRKFCHP